MSRTTSTLLSLVTAALLLGCAASYQPHVGDDAARVRIRLAYNGGMQIVSPSVRTIATAPDGRCGEITRLSMITPWVPTTTPQVGPTSTNPPLTYPRADMLGTTAPVRSDQAEYRLRPGRHQFTMAGTLPGPRQCWVAVPMDLEAGRQYELVFAFDTSNQSCRVTRTRMEAPAGGSGNWMPLPGRDPAVNCP